MLQSVRSRYTASAQNKEEALCCPTSYNAKYLKIIPQEIIEKDYGCGDPTPYIKEGDTVLDLGSGGGKICFIAAQIVGKKGKVIGVDMTQEMLDMAKRNLPLVSEKLGFNNIEFKHGYIQDLQMDIDLVDEYIQKHPIHSAEDFKKLTESIELLRKEKPLIKDNSVDVIVSNCVLNLVNDIQKKQLFQEMFRVLKKGGRIAISDIVSDESSPQHLKDNPELWSGCISGALQEREFLEILEEVGFYGISVDKLEKKPWRIVEGIEYRSAIITAYKGKEGPCFEKNQAVMFKGPWKAVEDDDGHIFYRGERMAVCEKTYTIMTSDPYQKDIIGIEPNIPVTEQIPFDCSRNDVRTPTETKKGVSPVTTESDKTNCCGSGCC